MLLLNGQPLVSPLITMFPDKTSQVWKLPELILSNTDYIKVKWIFQHEGEFLHIAQLKDLLNEFSYGALHTLEIMYLPYGRQDKEVSNDSTFALRTFAKLLNSLEFDDVIIHDPHSHIALDLIDNSKAVYPKKEVAAVTRECCTSIICYPDKGALSKYTKIYDYNYIYGEKVRDQLSGNITSYQLVGDPKGKNVLILDDLCDGGMTFKILAKDLLAAGANSVVLFVTHGIFSKGLQTLFDSGIQRIFTQDGEASENEGQIIYRRLS